MSRLYFNNCKNKKKKGRMRLYESGRTAYVSTATVYWLTLTRTSRIEWMPFRCEVTTHGTARNLCMFFIWVQDVRRENSCDILIHCSKRAEVSCQSVANMVLVSGPGEDSITIQNGAKVRTLWPYLEFILLFRRRRPFWILEVNGCLCMCL